MIVLDASVVLKWIFSDEDNGEKARRYRDAHVSGAERIVVPGLFFYEIANVLATKTGLSPKECYEAFSFIWNFDLESARFGLDEFVEAISLSRRYGISLYDASYVGLAQKLTCRFVTAEKRLLEKVKNLKGMVLL